MWEKTTDVLMQSQFCESTVAETVNKMKFGICSQNSLK